MRHTIPFGTAIVAVSLVASASAQWLRGEDAGSRGEDAGAPAGHHGLAQFDLAVRTTSTSIACSRSRCPLT